ncbi:MAG TPA: iron-containing alcohol dehydrogenase [Ramlibacter sp.]|nr:iron-containing alcohol dehydrogenase [Ramlibacter sp.]
MFGRGCLCSLNEELAALGVRRVLVLSTREQSDIAAAIAANLAPRAAAVFAPARIDVALESIKEAIDYVRFVDADGVLSVGGGTTIGLGNAIGLKHRLPNLAIPTTFSGSELAPAYGITDDRDTRGLPRTVLYDPDLVSPLPYTACVTSAFNAIAHAAEALYASDANPEISRMAEEGIRSMTACLRSLAASPLSATAREQGLHGASLCCSVLGAATMGLHHHLCHTLRRSWNLPHAETHTVMLPHTLAYNAAYAPAAMARAARALGATDSDAPRAIYQMLHGCPAPRALKDLGMPAQLLDQVADDLAMQDCWPNPRPLERAAIRQLLQDAYEGRRPRSGNRR